MARPQKKTKAPRTPAKKAKTKKGPAPAKKAKSKKSPAPAKKAKSRKSPAPAKKAKSKKSPAPAKKAKSKKGSAAARRDESAFGGMMDRTRALKMIELLKQEYPDARCMLDFESAFELLIATILAAQCTDVMVNRVTPELFSKYPTPQAFLDAPSEDIEKAIYKTGFYRNKTRSIKKCCEALVSDHGGKVPQTMEQLITLGGVGRKTANCVLGNIWGIAGVVVDTHVKRISNRMGYTVESNPDKIEQDLMKVVPEEEWILFTHLITNHGRSCCTARKPACGECPVEHLCPKILD